MCPNSIPTMSQKFYMLSPNGVIWKESQWEMPSSSFMNAEFLMPFIQNGFSPKVDSTSPSFFALNVDLYLN